MTPDEIEREITLIQDAANWPLGSRLPVKRWAGSGYECGMIYSACATSGKPVAIPEVFEPGPEFKKLAAFESVEAMVLAGWIGD